MMKALSGLLFFLLAAVAVAQSSLSSAIAELPPCAVRSAQLEKEEQQLTQEL
jgi:hypothetical protein